MVQWSHYCTKGLQGICTLFCRELTKALAQAKTPVKGENPKGVLLHATSSHWMCVSNIHFTYNTILARLFGNSPSNLRQFSVKFLSNLRQFSVKKVSTEPPLANTNNSPLRKVSAKLNKASFIKR